VVLAACSPVVAGVAGVLLETHPHLIRGHIWVAAAALVPGRLIYLAVSTEEVEAMVEVLSLYQRRLLRLPPAALSRHLVETEPMVHMNLLMGLPNPVVVERVQAVLLSFLLTK
jgi:hypothetical protein